MIDRIWKDLEDRLDNMFKVSAKVASEWKNNHVQSRPHFYLEAAATLRESAAPASSEEGW